jgi:arylsulfatase A-like enzyme
MNVILITMDGARVDRIKKGKNYQNIIKKSTFFSKVVAYAPYTISAMHAIFSGTYGTKTGVNSYWSSPKFKKDDYKTLTKYLKDAGYITYGDTINKLVLPKTGFDELVIHDEINDDLTKRHINLLEKFNKIRTDGKKFFLYLHYSNIHTGIMQKVLKKYDNFSPEYFDNREKNEIFYDELFENGDKYLGKIFDKCNELGISDDTLIVVISDHGISVGEKIGERAYGVFCYDYTLISTSIFSHKSFPTTTIESQVRSIDILPTILESLSIPHDPNYEPMDGKSLFSIIGGKSESRISFSQSGNPLDTGKPPKEPNIWAVRTDEWKFIKNIFNNTEELYDLQNDPHEIENVIDKYPKISDKLRYDMEKILNN